MISLIQHFKKTLKLAKSIVKEYQIEYKILTIHDVDFFINLIRIFEDVFEMTDLIMPPREQLWRLLKKPDFIAMVAMADDHVIGGLTAYTLHQYYSKKPLLFIYDLAIDTKFQEKGIGSDLLKYLNNFAEENGFEEAFLYVDEIDQKAIEFYKSSFSYEHEKVFHFYRSI